MRIQSLQVLRGVAAWAVVYHHYMQIFYNFESSNYIGEIFSQRGGFGVDLFFVLSGFVMFIAATRSSVNAKEFFLKRLFRVFPAYWFFTALLLLFTVAMPEAFESSLYDFKTILYSIFFIPHAHPSGVGIYPFLTVGWTLNYEVAFYTILSFCIFLNKKYAIHFCAGIVLILPIALMGSESQSLSVINSFRMWEFLFGIYLGWLFKCFSFIQQVSRVWGVLLLVFSVVILSGVLGYGLIHKAIAATMIVTACILLNDFFNTRTKIASFMIQLGDMSFSTYLCHVIIIKIALYFSGNSLGFYSEITVLTAISVLVYYISFISYKYIECFKGVNKLRDLLISINFKRITFYR
ncbi:acyltransferase [Vibrio alginolyticus]|uniref:acyltransferase family protein n=1 Tax=Vibrio alginolyticus TaxID=663 RepID=UPI001BD46695|nr:acyltransferase [Vibrio alginolyticus]MBS9881890.1 acyltransferase [Vibrio alginolyticus]MCR9896957.1 acyltransferase [Vibrio alginolyticus]